MRKTTRRTNTSTVEPTAPLSAEEAIARLSDSTETILNTTLNELSGLNQAEIGLLKNTWDSIEPTRRREIVSRLVEIAEDDPGLNFNAIFRLCLNDPDDEVRAEAIEGLWENEEPALIEPLIKLLEKDPSENVQITAATALGKFALLSEHNKLRQHYRDKIKDALLMVINDENRSAEVRRRALEAAGSLSFPEISQAIEDAYNSPDTKLKTSALYAMGKNLDSDWLPILLHELNSNNPELRYEACGACGELEDAGAVPALIELVYDPDTHVQTAAIQALGKIGTTQAKACLKQCLESQNEAVRQAAEHALSELETREDPLSFKL